MSELNFGIRDQKFIVGVTLGNTKTYVGDLYLLSKSTKFGAWRGSNPHLGYTLAAIPTGQSAPLTAGGAAYSLTTQTRATSNNVGGSAHGRCATQPAVPGRGGV